MARWVLRSAMAAKSLRVHCTKISNSLQMSWKFLFGLCALVPIEHCRKPFQNRQIVRTPLHCDLSSNDDKQIALQAEFNKALREAPFYSLRRGKSRNGGTTV